MSPFRKAVEKIKGADWRADIDNEVEQSIERVLRRIKPYESNYKDAPDPSIAQLWVAVAELNAKIDAVNDKLDRLFNEREKKRVKDEELRESAENY